MRKISYIYKAFIAVALLVGVYACEREDGEPNLDVKKFSRLYVSFEEYRTSNDNQADTNLRIIFPADSTEFDYAFSYVSNVKGGGPIYFNPYLQSLIHASTNQDGYIDTSAYVLGVGEKTGLVSNSGRLGNRMFTYVKGLAYHSASEHLLLVNGAGPTAGVYHIYRPRGRNGYIKPVKKLRTTGLPMWGAVYKDNQLFVSKRGEGGGIYVFDKIITMGVSAVDSTAELTPTRTLAIAGANNLRGMAYDTVRNILAVTDFVTGGAVGTGRILIFEKFSEMTTQATITPTRIITGPATLLKEPVEVALDTRASGIYLYVADRSKKILRFKISDNGNVVPDKELDTTKEGTPVGLALDTRDASTLGQ